MSDSEVSHASLSSPSQKFVPQEDDEETLWEVIEITAEKGNTYKVRWRGDDPKTMKPWPQSWVQKSDCTDDLVMEWRRKQREKKKRASKGSRLSTASKRTGRESTSTVGKAGTSKLLATPMSKSTRRSASTVTVTENAIAARPRKSTSIPAKSRKEATPTAVFDDDEEDVEPPPSKPKGTKRKLADATSANSSANHVSKNTAVDINVNEHGESHKKPNIGRPKKKRKVEVEIVKPELESEDESLLSYPKIQTIEDESHDIRKPKGRRIVLEEDVKALRQESEEEEAEEERMVEDALSQASSPLFYDDHDMDDFYATDVPEAPPQPSTPTRATESMSKDKGKGKQKEQVRAAPAAIPLPNTSPIKIGPPSKKRSLANLRKETTMSTSTSKPKAKAKDQLQIQHISAINTTSAKPARSPSITPPPSPPPPKKLIPISTTEIKRRAQTEERSDVFDGPDEFQYPEPILSPAAEARLALFDEEVMGIPRSQSRTAVVKTDAPKPKRDLKQQTAVPQPTLEKVSSLNTVSGNKAKPRTLGVSETTRGKEDDKAKGVAKAPSKARSVLPPSTANAVAPYASKTLVKPKDDSNNPKSKPASTTTTAASSKTLSRQPTAPPTHSYNTDVVPETDESRPQSQEAKIPTSQPAPTAGSNPPSEKPSATAPEPPTGPSKTKPLRPIPVLSPSTFHPHLPPSSLPEDISEEPSQSQRRRRSKIGGDSENEDDAPMSSIEQFDSPEKKHVRPTQVIMAPKKGAIGRANAIGSSTNNNTRQSASEIWESDVVKRGVQMAEAAKKKRAQSSRASSTEAPPPRMTMDEVIARTRSRSASSFSVQDAEHIATKPTPIAEADEDEDEDEDQDMGDVSTTVVPPASGRHAALDELSMVVQEMENAYVDLDGGADETQDVDDSGPAPPPVDPILLREEEEETSQDVMMDIQRAEQQRPLDLKMLEGGWGVGAPVEVLPAIPETTIPEDTKADASTVNPPEVAVAAEVIPEIVVSEVPPAQPLPVANDDHPPLRRSTRSQSRSRTPMPQPARTNGKAKNNAPSTPSIGRVSPSPAPQSNIQAPLDPAPENQLTAAIAKLEAGLAAERTKLTQQDAALQEQQNKSTEIAKQQEETSKQLSDLTARYEAERAEWENEKLQLTVQLDSANKAKALADNDREFFREQYAKASGFVSSVRDENKDLEKRIKIAEEQTQTGVNLVKATFDLRVKALEEDVRAWRRTAEFLIDKDVRSGNDEVRRRAAEEPELRALCQRQQVLYAKAQDRISELEAELHEKRRDCGDLEAEVQGLKAEVTTLHVGLNEALFKLDRIGRGDEYGNESVDATGNGHEFVYSCKWRTENESCREVFSTISELEHHLTTAKGHLHHSD